MSRVSGRGKEGPVDVGGYKMPPAGWGDYIIGENIEVKESEDKSRTSLIIPFQLESDDENDGAQVSWFLTVHGGRDGAIKKSEQQIADLLSVIIAKDGKTNLEESLNRKYPNEDSWLAPNLLEAYKITLGGKRVSLEIRHNADKNDKNKIYANIQTVAKMGYKPPAGSEKGKGATTGKAAKVEKQEAPPEDF